MYTLIKDLRLAFRQLMKAPAFGLTVVLPLALGIGAVTAMFSLVEGILLRPLPFREPGRLVLLGDYIRNSSRKPVTAPSLRRSNAQPEPPPRIQWMPGARLKTTQASRKDFPSNMLPRRKGIALLQAAVAMLACYVPARKAA